MEGTAQLGGKALLVNILGFQLGPLDVYDPRISRELRKVQLMAFHHRLKSVWVLINQLIYV